MHSWKWTTFALWLVSVPLQVSADPPDHAANKKPQPRAAAPDVLMARQAEAPPAAKEAADMPQQPTAAATEERGQSERAPEGAREGLRAGQGNLNAAAQRLEHSANLRERAEQARSRAWTRWKAKLLTEDAIDPKVQHELEKHARREAKLQRLGALAQQAGDEQALERLAKLRALEATLHEKHMQALMSKSERSAKEPAQP